MTSSSRASRNRWSLVALAGAREIRTRGKVLRTSIVCAGAISRSFRRPDAPAQYLFVKAPVLLPRADAQPQLYYESHARSRKRNNTFKIKHLVRILVERVGFEPAVPRSVQAKAPLYLVHRLFHRWTGLVHQNILQWQIWRSNRWQHPANYAPRLLNS